VDGLAEEDGHDDHYGSLESARHAVREGVSRECPEDDADDSTDRRCRAETS
jgi:hypothetical protein